MPLGRYMAAVYEGRAGFALRVLGPLERSVYRAAAVRPDEEMSWKRYAAAVLLFNGIGILFVYALQRLQGFLPLNGAGLPGVGPEVALNTAVSFASNTNWQAYGGETTLSHLTQMLGLTVQNFLSAATGMAVLVAQPFSDAGHFWSRPSATAPFAYNAAASAGSNLGPSNPALHDAVRARIDALRAADPSSTAPVPVDLVTASGSGLDPHLSPAAALYQVPRVARVRGLAEERVRALVESRIEGRTLGLLGETRVNVLLLNLDLDRLAPAGDG